jgi:serine/threonine-protein kinase RIO1
VPSDSEASSSEIDSEEDAKDREDRRVSRGTRRENTRRTIKEMRRRGTIPRYNDVDAITQWMDDQGDQAKVRN